ncbi:MAG: glycolate oxidase subunit GlcE [Gammaproteobacteria bacterium]
MNATPYDQTHELQEAVGHALAAGTPLMINGGGSKFFYGRETGGAPLNVKQHCGIINYQPSELVVTARSGTLLSELRQTLMEEGQMFAFEPPCFAETATLGGTVACGLSGSRRPFAGSVRDCVLGCKIINGKAEVLSFGGEVIKNVAGYDISRLMAGAMGTLGVLLEISLKVMPLPAAELTCCIEMPESEAIARMSDLAGGPFPVTGLSHDGQLLYIRLSGAEKAVHAAARKIGGDGESVDSSYWHALNEQKHGFFQTDQNLWRLCLPPATKPLPLAGQCYHDWGGGLRWLRSDEPAGRIFSAAEQALGHAILFKGKDRAGDVFHPLTGKLKELNANVKRAFDPLGLFNSQRMYRDW